MQNERGDTIIFLSNFGILGRKAGEVVATSGLIFSTNLEWLGPLANTSPPSTTFQTGFSKNELNLSQPELLPLARTPRLCSYERYSTRRGMIGWALMVSSALPK